MSNTIPTLKDGNYNKWSRPIKGKITSAGAWSIITGTFTDPGYQGSTDVNEQRLQRAWEVAEGSALGAILETVDAANYQLIDGMNAKAVARGFVGLLRSTKAAWDALKTAHNKQDENRQFLLFQQLSSTIQKPNESLTAYHQRVEMAADTLYNSLPSSTTAKNLIDSFAAFFSLQGLDKDDANEILFSLITVGGTVNCSTVAEAYRSEQTRRDTAQLMSETSLAARAGRSSSKGNQRQPANRPTCRHCQKAHKSDDCYKEHPDKMPQWMKDKNEAQRKLQEQRKATPQPTDGAHVAASKEPEDDDGEEEEGEAES
ncbi:hypothetical protein FRC01_012348, partial [Tulasnella sp. 417]